MGLNQANSRTIQKVADTEPAWLVITEARVLSQTLFCLWWKLVFIQWSTWLSLHCGVHIRPLLHHIRPLLHTLQTKGDCGTRTSSGNKMYSFSICQCVQRAEAPPTTLPMHACGPTVWACHNNGGSAGAQRNTPPQGRSDTRTGAQTEGGTDYCWCKSRR